MRDGTDLGPVLAAFSYDGLGRLIRTTRHDIKSVEGSSWQYEHKNQQEEHYYYDGVRRIQEVETTTPDGESPSAASRSYVWGTGYVDELVAQIEHGAGGDVVYYYLQDANHNVVGITDEWGNVVRQYTWTPYGELAATEDPAGTPPLVSRVGHQGLFFERFYANPDYNLLDPALAPVDVYGEIEVPGLYHNRNRWYSPELARIIHELIDKSGLRGV